MIQNSSHLKFSSIKEQGDANVNTCSVALLPLPKTDTKSRISSHLIFPLTFPSHSHPRSAFSIIPLLQLYSVVFGPASFKIIA
jgi:hypothetical protein